MPTWDVFKVAEFRQSFQLDESEVRRLIAAGELNADDCVRRSGELNWQRIGALSDYFSSPKQTGEQVATEPAAERPPRPAPIHRARFQAPAEPMQPAERTESEQPHSRPLEQTIGSRASHDHAATVQDAVDHTEVRAQAAEATQSRPIARQPSPEPDQASIEDEDDYFPRKKRDMGELDLTAMVDVTFLLVLFFMLTATYTLQQSIEVPTPDPEEKMAQQAIQTLDDLREDFIIISINADNSIFVDDLPCPTDFEKLSARIRSVVRDSGRSEVLIHAHDEALNETIVLAVDAANDVGVQRIGLGQLRD